MRGKDAVDRFAAGVLHQLNLPKNVAKGDIQDVTPHEGLDKIAEEYIELFEAILILKTVQANGGDKAEALEALVAEGYDLGASVAITIDAIIRETAD